MRRNMATKKATTGTKSYNVTGRIRADIGIDISASSWEEAVSKAQELKIDDFIDIQGDHYDSQDPEIRTIFINE
jgi:hypothetical protein